MRSSRIIAFGATLLLCAAALSQSPPVARDHTGIEWMFPFSKARKLAAADQRILLIKPVAFGTSPDGCW